MLYLRPYYCRYCQLTGAGLTERLVCDGAAPAGRLQWLN
jgi:hypothetical protein